MGEFAPDMITVTPNVYNTDGAADTVIVKNHITHDTVLVWARENMGKFMFIDKAFSMEKTSEFDGYDVYQFYPRDTWEDEDDDEDGMGMVTRTMKVVLNAMNLYPSEEMPIRLFHWETDKPCIMPGVGSIEPHPEGADRGGYVVVWTFKESAAYYRDGEWHEFQQQTRRLR